MKGFWFWLIGKNEPLFRDRYMKCVACKHNKVITCGNCGCVKQMKLRVKEEKCPIDKW